MTKLAEHVANLRACRRCTNMVPPPVSGGAVQSKVILVGQAPGVKEPELQRPFAWTAGKTLFKWLEDSCGISEALFRERVYIASVCRCFPGKAKSGGGDRVPNEEEMANCRPWLEVEFHLLKPELIIPVGKLAITQFVECTRLTEVIGKEFAHPISPRKNATVIPLPHPSGASTWHRMEPGKTLTLDALSAIEAHPAMRAIVS